MAREKTSLSQIHGPDKAEFEIRKAYNCVIEAGVTHFWDRRPIPGVNPDEVITIYKHAFDSYRHGNRLASERWARAAKHLARAFWHEAKIAYLEPRQTELAFLEGSQPEEFGLNESVESATDLLESAAGYIPVKTPDLNEKMERYLKRGYRHLTAAQAKPVLHELLQSERIKAAYEYARVLECMTLALEAETKDSAA